MKINLLKNYNYFILLIWGALWLNFLFQYTLCASFGEGLAGSCAIVLLSYPLTTWLSTTLTRKAMIKRKMLRFIIQFFGISWAISMGLVGLSLFFRHLESTGFFPPSELLEDNKGPFYEYINSLLVALFINFGFCGLRFFEENLKLQNELAHSQLEILRNQINPHFMFNVLNHIHVLMQKNVGLASTLLLQYADILRYQLYNGRQEYVSIGQETDFLKNYVEIEKLRWKNNLDVKTSWKIADEHRQLPPLLLIPFIENAFKHASRSGKKKGHIKIIMEQASKTLTLIVENSCNPVKIPGKEDSGIGMENIRKRLDILYPGKYRLEIGKTETHYRSALFITI